MQADTYYHVYNRANGSENLFREHENYRYFLHQWVKYIRPIADSLAYCLMPNHFHFLVKVKTEDELKEFLSLKDKRKSVSLSKGLQPFNKDLTGLKNLSSVVTQQFSNLFNSYSKAYNKKYDRNGSLFQRPFKSKEITSDNYLATVVLYIHQNPVQHGFAKRIKDWPFSSYQLLLNEKETFLERDSLHNWFGGKEKYQQFHQLSLPETSRLDTKLT